MSVMRMEIKLQPQFISSIYFHFTQKSKQTFYSGLALKTCPKNPPNKTLPQVVFLIFHFLRYLKHFMSTILIVIVLLNILSCNSRKLYAYTCMSLE